VELITPRMASSNGGGLDDQVYNRLLKERIIFLGSVVEDSMANSIAAQMLLLAAAQLRQVFDEESPDSIQT